MNAAKTFFLTPAVVRGTVIVVIALLLAMPFMTSAADLQLLVLVAIAGLFAQSINLLTGYLGHVSLGHAALYGVGAYGSAVLSVRLGANPLLSMVVGIGVAVLAGLILSVPAGRVKDLYLAMVTLGFGMVTLQVFREWTPVTGGFSGLGRVPSAALGNFRLGPLTIGIVGYYYLVIALTVLVTIALWFLFRSHLGRSFMAIHRSEVAARTMGIGVASRSRTAYLLSAALAGIAGVLYAHLLGFVSPAAFNLNASIGALVFAILGGMRSLAGPYLGAALITILLDRMAAFSHYQHLVYGLVLLLVFLVLPGGFASLLGGRTPLSMPVRERRDGALNGDGTATPGFAGEATRARSGAGSSAEYEAAAALEIREASLSFGGVRALDGVSLTVKQGEIHGLIGPNGSGKSTLLNVVSGIYTPDSGEVRVNGVPLCAGDATSIARGGLGRTFQHPQLSDELTVLENVLLGSSAVFSGNPFPVLFGAPAWRRRENEQIVRAREVMDAVGILDLAEVKAGDLPFGRQRMVELARVICASPSLIMLDEPAAGLAANDLEDLSELLRRLRENGTTIVIIEHHLDFLLSLVDDVTVLNRGRVLYRGTPEGVRTDPAVVEAYLGTSEGAAGA